MIQSDKNPKIQRVRALLEQAKERKRSSSFVVEGVRLVEEAFASGWGIELLLYSNNLSPRGLEIVAHCERNKIQAEEIPAYVMEKLAATATPQGILAVVAIAEPQIPQSLNFALICDAIRDPGNLGTILRTAAAAGVQAVFLAPGTTDPFAPKVIRSGMGAHFSVPIFRMNWEEIGNVSRNVQPSLHIYGSSANSNLSLWQTDLRQPLAIIVSGEAEGASPQATDITDAFISIPMPGGSESLNAAVAAGIFLFETVRQRSG